MLSAVTLSDGPSQGKWWSGCSRSERGWCRVSPPASAWFGASTVGALSRANTSELLLRRGFVLFAFSFAFHCGAKRLESARTNTLE